MLHRAVFFATLLCVILCFASIPLGVAATLILETTPDPVLFTDGGVEPLTPAQVTRNPDGSSVGIYYQRDLKLVIRRRGMGPGVDGDTIISPLIGISLLTVLPIAWFFTHRRRSDLAPGGRRFVYCCAATPFIVSISVLYLRRYDGNPIIFGGWMLVAVIIYAAIRLGRLPSRTVRRIRKGVCPRCAYDLRATPRRCPECGFEL